MCYAPYPPFSPFLSTFDKEGGIFSLPAVLSDDFYAEAQSTAWGSSTASPNTRTSVPTALEPTPSLSASKAATLQKGWLVTVGNAMMAVVLVLI